MKPGPAQLEPGAIDEPVRVVLACGRRAAGRRPSARSRRRPCSRARGEGVGVATAAAREQDHRRDRHAPSGEVYACVMHIVRKRARQGASVKVAPLCSPTQCRRGALARSDDAPPPPPPAARRRPPVPHRRRPRDHADLPPRARPAVLRRLRPAQGRRRPRRAARLLRALPRPRPRARRGLRPRHRDVARQPRLGAPAGLLARRPRCRQPLSGGAGRGDPRRRRGRGDADRHQRRRRAARRRL